MKSKQILGQLKVSLSLLFFIFAVVSSMKVDASKMKKGFEKTDFINDFRFASPYEENTAKNNKSNNSNIEKANNSSDNKENGGEKDKITCLFTSPKKECPNKNKIEECKPITDTEEGVEWAAPRSKKNPYEKMGYGERRSAYFFDYLDPLLQEKISDEFKNIYAAAKSEPHNAGEDPYDLKRLVNYVGGKDDELFKKVKDRWSSFNETLWQESVSLPQIKSILSRWKWEHNKSNQNPAKYFVDEFDFNGDGRLNQREFIFAMIIANKNSNLCTNCMQNFFKDFFDPMFSYFDDCSGTNYATAKRIWKDLRKLKFPENAKILNIYDCELEEGSYRTSAVNDFVLKSQESLPGKLSLQEFRTGLLLGYWNRQTTESQIYIDDTINNKNRRWRAENDIECSLLMEHQKALKIEANKVIQASENNAPLPQLNEGCCS